MTTHREEHPPFEKIVADYVHDVFRLCVLLLRNEEDARDVLQESLIRLARSMQKGQFRIQNGSIKGYLLKTARNLCIDHLRSHIRYCSLEDDEHRLPLSLWVEETPARVSQDRQFFLMFNRALQQLNDVQRTILVLHDVQEESYEEIARELNLTVNNVRTHLWRAREKMRRMIAPYIQQK